MKKTMDSNKRTMDIENQQGGGGGDDDGGGDNNEDNCRVRGDVCGSNAIVSLAFAIVGFYVLFKYCLLYTSPSPRDLSTARMPSSA